MKSSSFDLNQASSTSELVGDVKQPSKIRLILVAVLVVALILAVVFLVLYVKEKNGNDSEGSIKFSKGSTTTTPPTSKPTNTPQCSDPSCVLSSSHILRSIDSSVKPCDDFYQYSCGGFVKNNYIRDDQRSLNSFSTVLENVDYSLKELLEKQKLSNYSMGSAIYKALTFYQSCTNESQIEAAGTKPMLDIISKYGSWQITNDTWSNDTWNLEKILARSMVDLGSPTFISLQIGPDIFNTSHVVVAVGAGSSGLGVEIDEKLISSLSQQHPIILAYTKLMKTVFQLLGADSSPNSTLDNYINEIYSFEREFFGKKHSVGEQGALYGFHNVVKYKTIEELNNLTSYKFNWTLYFEEVLHGTNISLNLDQKLLVYLPNDIKNIINLITSKPKRLLANTAMWHVVHQFLESLPKAFQEARDEYLEVVTGVTTPTPRWRKCGDFTNNAFQYAIALLYSSEHLSEEARKRASDLFIEIRKQFSNGLNEQTWMDNATRKAAQVKLDAIKQDVGYPPFIKNPAALNKLNENVHVRPMNFLENKLAIFKAQFENSVNALGKPPDKSKFPRPPVGVNAFYNPQTNGIAVLMGMFQRPFYENDRLKALNYGGIGMVIGHEITHAFDVSGSQFDEVGNLRSWWSPSSFKNYKNRSECLKKQYDNTYVFGRKVDGVKTLSENIADNGGLKYTFRAYQKWRDTNGDEESLPGLSFTNDQLFFIGFAQTWCAKYREQNIDNLMATDTHSLNPVRVRVPLSNFPAFSKAFGCQVPPNRTICTVW